VKQVGPTTLIVNHNAVAHDATLDTPATVDGERLEPFELDGFGHA
jgi:hypothetical protein